MNAIKVVLIIVVLLSVLFISLKPSASKKAAKEIQYILECDELEIISLDPWAAFPKNDHGGGKFYGRKIYGSVKVTSPIDRTSVYQDIKCRIKNQEEMVCFEPRHGIRATSGSDVREYEVCFKCNNIRVYKNGERVTGIAMEHIDLPIAMDKLFEKAGIEHFKKAKPKPNSLVIPY